MPRPRRTRNVGSPAYRGGLYGGAGEGSSGELPADPMDVLSEAPDSGPSPSGSGINIEITNIAQAIAQAASEAGPGNVDQGASASGGGGKKCMMRNCNKPPMCMMMNCR